MPKGQAPPRGLWTAGQATALKYKLKERGEWLDAEDYHAKRKARNKAKRAKRAKQSEPKPKKTRRTRKQAEVFDFFDNIIAKQY